MTKREYRKVKREKAKAGKKRPGVSKRNAGARAAASHAGLNYEDYTLRGGA